MCASSRGKLWLRLLLDRLIETLPSPLKLELWKLQKKTSKSKAARDFNVDVRGVREWCKQKDE